MNRKEQKRFIKELSERIVEEIFEDVDKGKVPANWDGHELRSLLSYRHRLSAVMLERAGGTMAPGEPRRAAFDNVLLVNDL